MNNQFDTILDTSGLLCPEPVMMLHRAIKQLSASEILKVIATDPSTTRDIPKFCLFLGYELMEQLEVENHYVYYIKKS